MVGRPGVMEGQLLVAEEKLVGQNSPRFTVITGYGVGIIHHGRPPIRGLEEVMDARQIVRFHPGIGIKANEGSLVPALPMEHLEAPIQADLTGEAHPLFWTQRMAGGRGVYPPEGHVGMLCGKVR